MIYQGDVNPGHPLLLRLWFSTFSVCSYDSSINVHDTGTSQTGWMETSMAYLDSFDLLAHQQPGSSPSSELRGCFPFIGLKKILEKGRDQASETSWNSKGFEEFNSHNRNFQMLSFERFLCATCFFFVPNPAQVVIQSLYRSEVYGLLFYIYIGEDKQYMGSFLFWAGGLWLIPMNLFTFSSCSGLGSNTKLNTKLYVYPGCVYRHTQIKSCLDDHFPYKKWRANEVRVEQV